MTQSAPTPTPCPAPVKQTSVVLTSCLLQKGLYIHFNEHIVVWAHGRVSTWSYEHMVACTHLERLCSPPHRYTSPFTFHRRRNRKERRSGEALQVNNNNNNNVLHVGGSPMLLGNHVARKTLELYTEKNLVGILTRNIPEDRKSENYFSFCHTKKKDLWWKSTINSWKLCVCSDSVCVCVHPTPYIQHLTSNTLHPTPHIQHLTSNTIHPTPYIQHLTSNTLHPTPHIQHLTSNTLHPTPHVHHITITALLLIVRS